MVAAACLSCRPAWFPQDGVVTLQIATGYDFPDQVNAFGDKLFERLRAFSESRGDFRVVRPDSVGSSGGITHVLQVEIDSLHVVGLAEYARIVARNDSVATRVARVIRWIPVFTFGGSSFSVTAQQAALAQARGQIEARVTSAILLEGDHPSMSVHVSVMATADTATVWQEVLKVESASVVAIPPREQLAELLGILRQRLDAELPYFQ